MRPTLFSLLLGVLLASGAPVGPTGIASEISTAQAQAGQSALARQLRSDAVEAARSGDWARAADLFERSYELAPRPLTLITTIILAAGAGVALAFVLQEDEEPFQGSFPPIDFR